MTTLMTKQLQRPLDAAARHHFLSAQAATSWLPGHGMPQDRHARIAARRSFVTLKTRFMTAVQTLDGQRADWLRRQVRQGQEPGDLWLLRGAVFEALGRHDETTRRTREELQSALDQTFPDQGELRPLMRLA